MSHRESDARAGNPGTHHQDAQIENGRKAHGPAGVPAGVPFVVHWRQVIRNLTAPEEGTHGLTATEFAVAMALALFAPDCKPSVGRLARVTQLGVRTVRRDLGRLEEKGWIRRQVSKGGARWETNEYELVVPPRHVLPGCATDPGTGVHAPRHVATQTPAPGADEETIEEKTKSAGARPREAAGAREIMLDCAEHGHTVHLDDGNTVPRCATCLREAA